MAHSHLGARLPDTDKAGVLSTWKTAVCASKRPQRGGVKRPIEADRVWRQEGQEKEDPWDMLANQSSQVSE